jgi:hypothetical protein
MGSAFEQGALFLKGLLVNLAADPCPDFLIQDQPILT